MKAYSNGLADLNRTTNSKLSGMVKPSLIAIAVAQSLSISSVHAATIHVGGTDGAGCDLIGAIISANTDSASPDNACVAGSGLDTIELHEDITLTEPWQDTGFGLPLISSAISINGNDHTISRDINAANFGFIGVDRAGYLGSVNDLTLTNANTSGVVLNGAYEFNNVVLLNNTGAELISSRRNSQYMTIIDSRIENNQGTAISLNTGWELEIQNSTISNNVGRAIDVNRRVSGSSYPIVSISDSIISNNTADHCAAFSAKHFYLNLVINNTTISNNTALNNGGALCFYDQYVYSNFNSFLVNITNSTLSSNSAGGDGGAISAYSTLSSGFNIENSTVSNNSAAGMGGAISFQSKGQRTLPYVELFDTKVDFSAVNSTFVGNSASSGGAIYTDDKGIVSLSLANSIIAGNSAIVSGSEINHLSLSSFPADAEVVSNNNVLGSSLESNFQAFNGFTPSATDITATIDGNNPAMINEVVGPLQDNGGPTQTHAITTGSPASDAGDLDTCINDPISGLDQRGEARGDDNLCDIGAYEMQSIIGQLPTISVDNVEVSEGDSKVTLRVSLSSPQTMRIPVDYQTVDGTANDGPDYTGRFGTMTFAPGQTQKVRTIQLVDDNLVESTESFSLMLSNPVGATLGQAVGEVTVFDDDGLPTISIESAAHSVREGDSGNSRSISYTITLSSAQTEKVSLDYQTMDETAVGGVDYEVRSGTMTFMPGQTSKIRSIKVLGDTDVEPDETFKLVLSNPSNNAMLYIDDADSVGTIVNEDNNSLPTISIEPAAHSVREGDSGNSRSISYTITLSSAQTEKVSFDYQTMDETAVGGVDYEVRSGTMTFMPGQTSKIRSIKVLGDTQVESDETFKLVLSNPGSNSVLDVGETDSIGTILNDD